MASPTIDLIPLERLLHSLAASLRTTNLDDQWQTVEKTSRELANCLRVRDGPGPCLLSIYSSFLMSR